MNPVLASPRGRFDPLHDLLAARALRDFGDSFVAILLPAYLLALGFSPLAVGVLATASLFGSACLTLGAGWLGARHGVRRLLLLAAGLMVASGLAFATFRDYAVLLVIAFAGTINPSAGNVSVFVPLEHAAVAREAGDQDRTRMFARYSLAGAMAAALGALLAGAPELAAPFGIDRLTTIRAMFVLYALLGVAGRCLYMRLPRHAVDGETAPVSALGPSRGIVVKLAALFSLDAFAGGFVVQSLLALWLFQRFHLSLTAAGVFFFGTGLLAALSYPVLASRKVQATFDVADDPDVLAFDAALGWLYVAGESGEVSIFKVAGHDVRPLATAMLGPNAHVVAVDGATHQAYFPLKPMLGQSRLRITRPQL